MAAGRFTMDLQRFRNKVDKRTDAVVRKIVLDVGTALVLKSPVGDPDYWAREAPPGYVGGRFRANWQYGLNEPSVAVTEDIDPTGGKSISGIVGKLEANAAGKSHFITNSLAYGPRLEEGYSRQAPNGMVALTVKEFRPIVAAAARSLL